MDDSQIITEKVSKARWVLKLYFSLFKFIYFYIEVISSVKFVYVTW